MGLTQSKDSETINWNNIKTNEMSSTLPNLNGISFEAEQLLSKLNLPEISETNSDFDSNFIFNKHNQHNQHSDTINNKIEDGVSSPFISSEMYNYLVNKYNKDNNMVGGGKIDDDEDTSETSSSSEVINNTDSDDSEETKKETKKDAKKDTKKNAKKDTKKEESEEIGTSEDIEASNNYEGKRKVNKSKKPKSYKGSETYLSYVSSSAHTGGSISETIPNENNYSISSVNTSDLNYISDN